MKQMGSEAKLINTYGCLITGKCTLNELLSCIGLQSAWEGDRIDSFASFIKVLLTHELIFGCAYKFGYNYNDNDTGVNSCSNDTRQRFPPQNSKHEWNLLSVSP